LAGWLGSTIRTIGRDELAESLQNHAKDVADYLNVNVLDHDELAAEDILDALGSLSTTLVEDLISDSTQTYYEMRSKPDDSESEDRRN
jgi:hypothetical protein